VTGIFAFCGTTFRNDFVSVLQIRYFVKIADGLQLCVLFSQGDQKSSLLLALPISGDGSDWNMFTMLANRHVKKTLTVTTLAIYEDEWIHTVYR
jgi:hypothetical protein